MNRAERYEAAGHYPIAVYGTLRWQCGNDRLWHGRAVSHHDGTAFVIGYKLVTNGGFPYLVPARAAQTVVGLIVPHTEHYEAVLERMDYLEGVPHHYRRITIGVLTPGPDIVTAWTYVPVTVPTDWRGEPLPDVPTNSDGRFDWLAAAPRRTTTNERNTP